MTKEKIFDASKQENQSQDQFAAERLTDKELENVAGGTGGGDLFPAIKIINTEYDGNENSHTH